MFAYVCSLVMLLSSWFFLDGFNLSVFVRCVIEGQNVLFVLYHSWLSGLYLALRSPVIMIGVLWWFLIDCMFLMRVDMEFSLIFLLCDTYKLTMMSGMLFLLGYVVIRVKYLCFFIVMNLIYG